MKTEIVEWKTLPSVKSWSGASEILFVAFYDGVVSNAVIFLPGMVILKSTSAWNREELVEKKSLHTMFNQRSAAKTTTILPGIVQHLKPQPLRHVQLQGFKTMESLCNEEFLSMARTLVLDYKDFLEDKLSSLLNLAHITHEHSLSTAYNQAMVATMGPSDVEPLLLNPSNPRYLALKGLPFVALYDGTANSAVIFLPGAVQQINALASTSRMKGRPFVAFCEGMVASAQIFLGAIEQANALTPSNGIKAGLLRRSCLACYEEQAASARALIPIKAQLKPRPLRHVPLVRFNSMEFTSMTYNGELVLAYRDFLEDQLSRLLNLAILKREQSLATTYNQAVLATMGQCEVNSLVSPSSNPQYLSRPKAISFVAFYNGTANTAVIFLRAVVEKMNGLITSSRKEERPFVSFYDEMEATAQISLPGAVEQANAAISSNGIKTELLRRSFVDLSEIWAASAHALMPVNDQKHKPQPLRHVQLRGFQTTESLCNEEFLCMAMKLVLECLEDQLSSLLNLALLKREQSLSTAYNQVMIATMGPSDVESLVRPAPNSRYLPRPFIAFYEGVVATSVVFLPGHVAILASRPSTPRKSTRMETKPNQDIVHKDGILATAHIFLPYLERQSDVQTINPRLLFRPQWSRDEKCRLLRDKLDGLPLRYKARTTKYITFEEKDIDTRQRILNTIDSMKTVSPGSCLARSSLTPCYFLEETYPDMVSATLKDLATQHMKYFRASPSRAPGQRAGRTQIQILEDLYWEKLRKMGAPETADEIASRRQQEMCFNNKLWYGSVIKKTNLKSDHETKSVLNTRTSAQLNNTGCLNTNNNGYTREEGDCDQDTANSSVLGSKSDQGFSRGQDLARKKPRHSYLNKRHSDGYRSRNRGPAGMDETFADFHNTHIQPEPDDSGKDTGQSMESTPPLQCQRKDAILTHRGLEKVFNPTDRGLGRIFGSFAPHELSSQAYDERFFEVALFQKGTPEDDAIHLKELLKDVSNFDSISDVPESTLLRVALLTCKPFLKSGYNSGLGFLSKLKQSPECSPELPIKNMEHRAGPCGSTGSAAVGPTHSATEKEANNIVQKQRDVLYREACCMRLEQFQVFEAKSTNDDDFIGDLPFTDNSPNDRTESPRSFLHDDFIHEDDILDSILSPSRASLGQAYPSGHSITFLSTLDHDEDKPASHEPFPSEYVFKKVYGPSFRVSSEYWHIQIPTLPSDMVDYKVEADGLTEIVIGSGCFGKVYAATLTVSSGQSRDVVVKEHFTDKTTQESIASEAKIAMYLESTGCVPMCYGLLNDEDGYNIVMEYVGSGQTLYDVMRELELPRLHWLNIACQLVSGLNKIHKKDVLINDIKLDNILVDMSGELPVVKFCDMGLASYKSGVTYEGDMKNCAHLAPEACAYLETTTACDVFSLGRVLKKIHGVSQISILLAISDMCMAEDPASRPTLEAANQLLQGEYTRELMFPTLTVPSHLDSIDEESQEESAGSVLRVNTPVDEDQPTAVGPGTAQINDAVSRDSKSVSCSPRSSRRVSLTRDQASVTTISKHELGTSLAAADPAEFQDMPSISIDHVPHIHVAGSSHRHAVSRVNMTKGALSSVEVTDIPALASKSAQKQTETVFNNTEATVSKSAQSGHTGMANIVDAATTRSAEHGNGSLDSMPPEGTCDIPAAFSSPDGSYVFNPPPVPPSSPASSYASCHLQATSSSIELSLAANSPKFPVTMETLDTASELLTSPSHTYDASSDMFVDAVEDLLDSDADSEGRHSDTDINEAAAVDVDGNLTSPSLEGPHLAEYRAMCHAELDVFNKYCEDTSVYEDYLPLVLPLIMLPLGFFGLI